MDTPTTPTDLNATLARLRAAQQRNVPTYRQRMDDLKRLRIAFKARSEEFATAMSADFGRRSRHESLLSDTFTVLKEIDYTRRHLRGWMRSPIGSSGRRAPKCAISRSAWSASSRRGITR
jgi:coniferyl-aldehyde dehydrogenase